MPRIMTKVQECMLNLSYSDNLGFGKKKTFENDISR